MPSRVPQSVVLSGPSRHAIESVARKWAAAILKDKEATNSDLISIRPGNKMRQIGIEKIRELVHAAYHSPLNGDRKVILVHEAHRLNTSAANALLKTLEEPPENTTLFLLTERPYELPLTVRSRCWWVTLPGQGAREEIEEPFCRWLADFSSWLNEVVERPKECNQERLMAANGLLYRFYCLRQRAIADVEKQKIDPSVATDEAEVESLRVGLIRGRVEALFVAVEETMRQVLVERNCWLHCYRWIEAVDLLEHAYGFVELNLPEEIALETVFWRIAGF
jgi:hypothetical protein